jgi:hypothetical protein
LNKSKEKLENPTIPSGLIAAHGHSGLLVKNPAGWPKATASARGVTQSPMMQQRLISDEVFTSPIYMDPPMIHDNKT